MTFQLLQWTNYILHPKGNNGEICPYDNSCFFSASVLLLSSLEKRQESRVETPRRSKGGHYQWIQGNNRL